MKDFRYRLLKGSLTLVACLPLRLLYIVSDFIFLLIYYIGRYRRKLVAANLRACFPARSDDELKAIEKKFYRNFADYVVETLKLLHISDAEISRRMTFEGLDIIDKLLKSGRSVVLYFSHCGNWEWAPSMTLHAARRPGDGVEYCQVYRPLKNSLFDKLMLDIRGRFGSLSFAKQAVLRDLIVLRRKGVYTCTGFMSDQKSSHGDPTVVTTFLNRPTAFISGTEQLASRLGFAVAYWDMEKISRGRYHLTCRLIADDASQLKHGQATLAYASMLEQTILRNPSIWLWTHNRWKNPVKLPLK
ncbi:MAG: acetyltransferase [Muribaculaceae bacterium]|jgi:KDO2-lipid IV(A) lauroyltransferase|nr:acetyltransferase [Muribaculaceae bacterium]